MKYKALYRTYRPSDFSDVVGQQHIVKTLQNAIKEGKLAHAYLFCGPRGTGKTSIAKLLAKAVNCEGTGEIPCNHCASCIDANESRHPDIIEIDAASHTSVDKMREIIDQVKYAPMEGKYKVYIIDEVHMLSTSAFNALLKTLEEPPEHVIFILATTDPQKVLPTIISRCQRYNFEKVTDDNIVGRLSYICEKEGIHATPESLELIADLADGGMRDALSILDQFIAYNQNEITVDDVNEVYGITTVTQRVELLKNIVDKDAKSFLKQVEQYDQRGIDIQHLTNDLIDVLKECVIYSYTKDQALVTKTDVNLIKDLMDKITSKQALEMIDVLMEGLTSYRNTNRPIKYFEVSGLKLMELFNETPEVKVVYKEVPAQTVVKEVVVQKEVKEVPKEEPKVIEPEVVEEEKVEIKPIVEEKTLDSEFILSVLVKCTKQDKMNDNNSFKQLNMYRNDFECARYIHLLDEVEIAASGNDCMILTSHTDMIVNMINDSKMNRDLFDFLKDKLTSKKMIYAVTKLEFEQITNQFRTRYANGTLPQKATIKMYEEVVVKEKTNEEKLIELFGIENIEIIKE